LEHQLDGAIESHIFLTRLYINQHFVGHSPFSDLRRFGIDYTLRLEIGLHYTNFEKLRKATISFGHACLSVRMKQLLLPDVLSRNLTFQYFSKIREEN
jgi:hypothetical protein